MQFPEGGEDFWTELEVEPVVLYGSKIRKCIFYHLGKGVDKYLD
jgi:hypothetical protein